MCQDTGTATIIAKKGQRVFTGGNDAEHLARGVFETYTRENLRYSQTVPLTMYEEANSGTNLPAQIDIYASDGMEYHFLMIAKGGGSANKTYLFQETKALLNPKSLLNVPRREAAHARHGGLPAVPPRRRDRRHLGRGVPEDGQARLGARARRPADGGEPGRPGLPRPRAGGGPARDRAQDRDRRAVRRQVLRARRARRPAAPARGLVPDRDRRLVLRGPEHPRQDRPSTASGSRRSSASPPASSRSATGRRASERRSRSTSAGR